MLVSTEDQEAADTRLTVLCSIPADFPVIGISAEPLLGPIDLHAIRGRYWQFSALDDRPWTPLEGADGDGPDPATSPNLKWVIVGGEDGAVARDNGFIENARSLRAQCVRANTPFFGKQNVKKRPLPTDLQRREFPRP